MFCTAAAATSLQSCPTLCNPIDGSPPGSPVPGILQAGTLEWVAISFSNAWKWKVKVKSLSHVRLIVTPWTLACQGPLSMGILQAIILEWVAIPSFRGSSQPRDWTWSLAMQADSLPLSHWGSPIVTYSYISRLIYSSFHLTYNRPKRSHL